MLLALNAAFIEFTIPGKAVAWQRNATFRDRGGNVHQYQPAETRAYQNLVALACRAAMNGQELIEGPVTLDVEITLEIPQSWSARKHAEARCGDRLPTGRPDIDNIVKSIKDGLNGVAWRDDAQVCQESHRKQYGLTPGVLVRVATLMAKGHK